MTILLFILTAILVGYVVYTFYSSDAGKASSLIPPGDGESIEKPAAAEKPGTAKQATAAAEPVNTTAATATEPEVAETKADPTQYRNPETGDTAAVPSNYRFAKRWIKEALVTEGLLDKIYKNNELDKNASKKVKAALEKFKEIKKYHA